LATHRSQMSPLSILSGGWFTVGNNTAFNPLALELDIYSLAHHLRKM